MIVDDNHHNLKNLSYIFELFKEKYCLNIHRIEDGNLAVNLFQQKNKNKSDKNINLIFMDLNMN